MTGVIWQKNCRITRTCWQRLFVKLDSLSFFGKNLMSSKPRSVASCLLLVAALLPYGMAHADANAARVSGQKFDKTLQGLKQDVLDFNRDASAFERDALYPAYSRVAIYLGVRVNNLLVQQITLSIDNGEPHKVEYTDKQSRALFLGSNIDRLIYANVPPGPHRLHVEYVAQYDRSNPDAKPITGSYDAFFDKTSDPSELELVIAQGRNKSKPALSLKEWRRLK